MRHNLAATILLFLLTGPSLAESLIAPGAKLKTLGDSFKFTEGPAAHPRIGDVYFTDIPNNRIHRFDVATGKITVALEESQGVNGLYFDGPDWLIGCQGDAKRVVAFNIGKIGAIISTKPIAEKHDDKPFNKPNDLWIDPDGGIYFSDPNYGNRPLTQDGENVYYLSADRKTVTLAAKDFKRPNGLIGTPDGKTLYITDRGDNKTYRYDITAPGKLGARKLLFEEGSDGMTLDERGNIYITPPAKAVHIYSPEGKLIEKIELPVPPANITFGGKDRKTLFITARQYFLSIEMAVKGN